MTIPDDWIGKTELIFNFKTTTPKGYLEFNSKKHQGDHLNYSIPIKELQKSAKIHVKLYQAELFSIS